MNAAVGCNLEAVVGRIGVASADPMFVAAQTSGVGVETELRTVASEGQVSQIERNRIVKSQFEGVISEKVVVAR